MNPGTESRPQGLADDIGALHALVHRYEGELGERDAVIAEHEASIAERDAMIEHLQEQVRLLLAQRFAPSSERIPEGQLGLFNEAEASAGEEPESAPGTEVGAHRRAKPKRAPLPESLPRIDIEHELDEHERVCPHHGVELERFGEVVSEQLDIIPAKVQVLRHVRGKYRCPECEGHLRTAPMPAQPLAKSIASLGCWPTSPRGSTPMHCRCIASASSFGASGWSCRVPPWRGGWWGRARWWCRWSTYCVTSWWTGPTC